MNLITRQHYDLPLLIDKAITLRISWLGLILPNLMVLVVVDGTKDGD